MSSDTGEPRTTAVINMVPVAYEYLDVPEDVKEKLPERLPDFMLAGPGRNGIRVTTPFGDTERVRHVPIWAVHYQSFPSRVIVVVGTPINKESSDG